MDPQISFWQRGSMRCTPIGPLPVGAAVLMHTGFAWHAAAAPPPPLPPYTHASSALWLPACERLQVLEAVEQLAALIKLQNYSTFTLFECRKAIAKQTSPEPVADEHILMDDNKYIADIMCEFRNNKQSREVRGRWCAPRDARA